MRMLFWSGVTLTGNETRRANVLVRAQFWSGVTLTGNETEMEVCFSCMSFGAVSP